MAVVEKINIVDIIKRFTPCSKEFVLLEEESGLSNDNKYKITRRKFRHAVFENIEIEKTTTECLYPYMVHEDEKYIKERSKWEPFGQGKMESNYQDDVFMEYNPKLLFNSRNKKVLRKHIEERKKKQHKEDIKFYEDGAEEDYDYDVYRNYMNLLKIEKEFNEVNDVLNRDYTKNKSSNKNDINKNETDNKKDNIVLSKNAKSTYLPPHLRKNNDNEEHKENDNVKRNSISINNKNNKNSKNVEYDKNTLKLSNYPEYVSEEDINNFINSILPRFRFRINYLYHRDTKKLKHFCFIKFNHEDKAKEALDIINGTRFENSILSCEYSIKK
jgi:hypothetical protein